MGVKRPRFHAKEISHLGNVVRQRHSVFTVQFGSAKSMFHLSHTMYTMYTGYRDITFTCETDCPEVYIVYIAGLWF